MDFDPIPELHLSMLNSSHDKIGLNLKLKRTFGLALENILGPSVVIHKNTNSTTYYQNAHNNVQSLMAEWSEAHHLGSLVIVVIQGSRPGMNMNMKQNWTNLLTLSRQTNGYFIPQLLIY